MAKLIIRAICVAIVFLLTDRAGAEPNLPQTAESAAAYRKDIESLPVDRNVAQLLRAIKQAEAAGNPSELIHLYEQLIALNGENPQAWLQLGLAWRAAEPSAEKGLAAAFNAYGRARSVPDQLEALLLMSSVLRTRLNNLRKDYDSARDELANSARLLLYLIDATKKGEAIGIDPNDPAGNIRVLSQTRDAAARRADETLQQIARVAADLDEIYRDIAGKVPGLDAEKMKVGDSRSSAFAPVAESATGKPRVDFRIDGNDVRACIEFTQGLHASGLIYRQFIEIKGDSNEAISRFGSEVQGKAACITGLEPGKSYSLQLRAGLPSKEGTKLADDILVEQVTLPNLPQQIAFLGRHFLLPTNGPGEVPLLVTNLETFDLELFRITDRTLFRHIALGHIGGELPYKEYAELKDRFAERFWSGTVEVAAGAAKSNETIRAFLPVRSILDQRREWLQKQIGADKGNQGDMSSLSLPVANVADKQIKVEGRFFASSMPFEAATFERMTPGVYALVTRNLIKSDDTDEPGQSVDKGNCSIKTNGIRRQRKCGGYLVQWFLNTDIGLTFYEGDRDLTVIARSLHSGEAKANAKIELVSASNRVLDAQTTDKNGVATFARSLTRGTQANALVAILAHEEHDKDFAFLSFGPERLDLSRLNIDGRPPTDGFGAFLTTDRGIYQPGETIHLLALMRNSDGLAPEPVPRATVRLETRDRVLVEQRLATKDWALGGTALSIELPRTIRPGSARIALSLGDGGNAPVIGETIVQVGAIRPDRARLNFVDAPNSWSVRKTPGGFVDVTGEVNAQYLFGAEGTRHGAARDLKAEIVVKIAAADSPARGCYENFAFGRFDDKSIPVSTRQFVDYTDASGNLKLALSGIPIPETTRPMAATVEVTVFDAAGPLASRNKTFAINDDNGWIGVSKIPRLRPGAKSGTFNLGMDLISVTRDNRPDEDRSFNMLLERERDVYVWERRDNSWQHAKSVHRELVASSSIAASRLTRVPAALPQASADNCVAALEARDLAHDLEVGRYRLTISDPHTGRQSSVRFHAGAAATDPDQLEPNIFTLSTDKKVYGPNESVEFTAEVSFDGEVMIAFADRDVSGWASGRAVNGVAKIKVPVSPRWAGRGMYALATAFRSGSNGTTNGAPARAIGATYFEIKGEQAGYGVAVNLMGNAGQGFIALDSPLSFEVCITAPSGGCSANAPAEAYAAAFVADEGLLSLTGHHEPIPDPERFFYGQKRFGLRIMDNYDRLLLKDGGDRPTRLALSNYTSIKIVSEARGPVRLQNGKTVFTIPKLDLVNGAVSVYVVVWSKDYGAATSAKVQIRSHVVADLDVVNFLLTGDRAILPVRLENIDFAHQGDFAVRIAASGPIKGIGVVGSGDGGQPDAKQVESRVALPPNAPKTIYLAVDTLPNGDGKASLSIVLDAIGSAVPLPTTKHEWTFDVRPPGLASVDTIGFSLPRQGTNLSRLVEGIVNESYVPDSVTVTARFSDSAQALVTSSVGSKKEPPAPILDHLVWRGTLLLAASQRAKQSERSPDVIRLLGEVQSLQIPNGSFVPYRTDGNFSSTEISLTRDEGEGLFRTASALDFLSLASGAGYDIAEKTLRSARQFISTQLRRRAGFGDACSLDTAYALLVLLNSGDILDDQVAALKDCPAGDLSAKAAAAAVWAKYGSSDLVKAILDKIGDGKDPAPFKDLSDLQLAMTLAFLAQAGGPQPLLETVADVLLAPGKRISLSEADAAWVARATSNPGGGPKLTASDLQVEGAPANLLHEGQDGVLETAPIPYGRLRGSPISIGAKVEGRIRGLITIEGVLRRPVEGNRLPARAVQRRFFDLESGREIDPGRDGIKIGDRLAVVLEGNHDALPVAGEAHEPLLVADLLPSAFQIVSSNVFGQPAFSLRGALGQLKARGDLRSFETDTDRWVALIVPESRIKTSDEATQESNPAPAKSNDADAEFRQGYVVRVNMAGRFTLPAVSLEPISPPIRSLRGEQASISIKLPDASDR